MAGITLAQANANLSALLTAASKEDGAATISMPDGRHVTYRGLDELTAAIKFWDSTARRLSRGGRAVRGVTPL